MTAYKFIAGDLTDYEFWRWSALEQVNLEACVPSLSVRCWEWVPLIQDRDRLLDDARD